MTNENSTVAGPGHATVCMAGVLNSKPTGEGVMEKLLFEISKKMFNAPSIFILAVVVVMAGIVTISKPSLGTLDANRYGKVKPPSSDKNILTNWVLIRGPVVPATSQRIVCCEPDDQFSPPFGKFTLKGPVSGTAKTA